MGSVVALVYSHVFNSLAKKYYYSYILPFIVAYYVYSIDDINVIGFKIITLVFVVAIFSYFARYFSSSLIVKILLFIGYFILLAILTSVLILTFDTLFGTRVINHYLNFALVILILLIDLFFYDDKIYFYCDEYMLFWTDIDKVGDLNKSKDFKLKDKIVPATLEEISKEGLISSIHSVKQYAIENGKVVGITYIHLDS